MDKPTVFVGSSKEGLATARAIKEQLNEDAVVTVWDENVFQLNKGNLESLLRAANMFEFGILVYTRDDKTISRGKAHRAPRDNVLFEHGLFLGRLGPNRAFFICEKGVKIPSDFYGITSATYEVPEDGNLRSAVGSACNRIRSAMETQLKSSEISLLPSTALAIGYFRNFIQKVVDVLMSHRGSEASPIKKIIITETTDDHGNKKRKEEAIPIAYKKFTLNILIPDDLTQVSGGLIHRMEDYVLISLDTPQRMFPFYVLKSEKENQTPESLELFDIPTTLLASREAIDRTLDSSGKVGLTKDHEILEKREIRNFAKTLENLTRQQYGKNTPYLKIG